MKRSLTIALTLALALWLSLDAVATAQPAARRASPASAPDDPYAEKPDDPYAEAPPATPPPGKGKPTGTAKPKGKAKAKAKGNGTAEAPIDPYAPPPLLPAGTPAASKAPKRPPPADPTTEPTFDPNAPKLPRPARPEQPPQAVPARISISDLAGVQGLLAVQRLDGWLLFDRGGENPIAVQLARPEGSPTRPWFYLLPARGEPIALVHSAEQRSFEHLPGKKLTYRGYRDFDKQLRAMLKGVRTVAVEYSAKAAVPSISRVDAGTIELIRATGVNVRSSDTLVQFTKAIWGDAGRTAHHIAVHHLLELRKDALAFVAKAVQTGQSVTEHDVQQRLVRGMTMRGLASTPPVVAAGVNTADPYYVPTAAKAVPIKRGDLLVLSLALKLDKPDGVWAAQTWVAIVDDKVPEPISRAFETASLARDQALSMIADRARKRRAVTGAEVDDTTRSFIKKSGLADNVMHRTGHSLDNDLQGGGADLDNYEVKDTRILTPGTGFTVGPGLYFAGQFGVRTEVSVYLAPSGPEVTTPAQDAVEALLQRRGPPPPPPR